MVGNHANPVSSSTSSHPMFTWPPCQCGLTPQTSGLTPHLRETPRPTGKSRRDPPLASGTSNSSYHESLVLAISVWCIEVIDLSAKICQVSRPSPKKAARELWSSEAQSVWNFGISRTEEWNVPTWPPLHLPACSTGDTCRVTELCHLRKTLSWIHLTHAILDSVPCFKIFKVFFMPSLTRPEKWELDDTCNSFQ